MKKRITSILLALLLASSSFALFSCGENEVNQDETDGGTATSGGTEAPDESESEEVVAASIADRLAVPDDLPDVDYDGEEIRFMTKTPDDGSYSYLYEIAVEDLTGDACNDAVYKRNINLMERFGITINAFEDAEPHKTVTTFATAGTKDAHIVGFSDYLAYEPIIAQSLLNWHDAKYTNLDKPWHNKLANDAATINGQLYALCSDISISSMTYTYAMYCNTTLAGDWNYTAQDFYDLVEEGTWTIDKLIEITRGMYVDTNGSGTADISDTYGFGYYPNNPADVWLTAFGGQICKVGEDGKSVELTFMSDKTVSILEKLLDWHYNIEGFNMLTTSYEEETYFLGQTLVIAPMRFSVAYGKLREMDATYIILPYPKWDEAQETYYTMADDKFSTFGIPTSVYDDMDMISIIYEAMSAESYKTVYPEYYDTALKGRYSSDPTTAEMVDLIMEGRSFDFSVQFGNSCFNRLFYQIRDMIKANNPNLASEYRSLDKTIKKAVEKILYKAYNIE